MENIDATDQDKPVLHYEDLRQGIQKYTINLNLLYPNGKGREIFESKWGEFYTSDKYNSEVFWRKNNEIIYLSELLIPEVVDERPPLLLVFGNPAPRSIKEGMFFSYEGSSREHRVWKILRDTGIVEFSIPDNFVNPNDLRKIYMYSLNYNSYFRIGLVPFYSFATTSSAIPWTGVSGLYRLFGKNAVSMLATIEQQRLRSLINKFMPDQGYIITFQKDAYEKLSANNTQYSIDKAKKAQLIDQYIYNDKILLAGSPPTRSLQGKQAKSALQQIVNIFSGRK